MKTFLTTLPRNLVRCFSPRYLPWHIVAIALTSFLVLSGFDGAYFSATRGIESTLFSAAIVGGLMPLLLPLVLLACGAVLRSTRTTRTAWALAQAEIVGLLLSFFYKAFTGRAHPSLHAATADISKVFDFGFLHGGVFWGWPSSHTTVAFAMAAVLWALYPKSRPLQMIALVYALFIGIGVSVSIHWFSDFAAGAIFGIVAGTVVGKSFRETGN